MQHVKNIHNCCVVLHSVEKRVARKPIDQETAKLGIGRRFEVEQSLTLGHYLEGPCGISHGASPSICQFWTGFQTIIISLLDDLGYGLTG